MLNQEIPLRAGFTGLIRRRCHNALLFSIDGLRRVWQEEAFRVESVLILMLLPIVFLVDLQAIERAGLIAVLFAVMIVETLNTAVEVAINRTSLELHPLSKAAKDLGSAAVLLTILMAVIVWAILLLPNVMG